MLGLPNEAYPFEANKFKLASGVELAYLDEGDKKEDAPCMLMVHGNPTWSFYYRNLVRGFSEKMRCVVPDHIGCGQSDKPQDYNYTLKQHIDNLEALITSLDLNKIVLVLHDWGGAIGMGLAVRYPEKIKGLIILNTAAFYSPRIPFRIQVCKWPVIGTFINRGLNGFVLAAVTMATAKGKSLSPEVAKTLISPYDSWKNRIAIDSFVKDIPVKDEDAAYAPLQEIENNLSLFKTTPKIILWGAQDFCFNDSFYKKWLEVYPDAESHYYEDGGHYILEDCIEEIKMQIEKFLPKVQSVEL